MKNILIISLCFIALLALPAFVGMDAHAQDAIYKKDKIKVEGKVLEVGASEIKYKLASNPDGPIYTISTSDIVLITYQNGSYENFSDRKSSRSKSDSLSVKFCRNFIGVDIGEFATTSIGMFYEHTFGKKGKFALRIPFSVSLNQGDGYYNSGYPDGKIFSTGIDFLYFPTGQGKLRYYAAPYFEWGMFRYRNYYFSDYSTIYYPNPNYYKSGSDGHHFAGGIKNGLLYQATRHFSISADLGFGIKYDEVHSYYSYSSTEPHFKGNLLIGYRF